MKKRFKLYKSGKKWCVAAIVALVAGFSLSLGSAVHADVVTAQSVNNSADIELTNNSATPSSLSDSTSASSANSPQTSTESTLGSNSTSTSTSVSAYTSTSYAATSTGQNGWVKQSNGSMAYYRNGQLDTGREYVQLNSLTNSGKQDWYLLDNGIAQSGVQKWMGTYYYFDPTTYLRVDNSYREQVWQDGTHDWYMFGNDGKIITGVYNWQGSIYYFDPSSYLRVDNQYIATQQDGRGYLFGNDGRAVSGVNWWQGTYYYFDPVSHLRVDHDYREQVWSNGIHDWYMFGDGGRIVTGAYNWQGSLYYFDPSSYLKVTSDYRVPAGADRGYLLSSDGRALSGFQNWQGTLYYFNPYTYQLVKNSYFFANGQLYWANDGGFLTRASLSNTINNYILNSIGLNNHAQIQYDYVIPNVTGAYSGTSNGKPNMVVVHETANPNDGISGEINYEKNTYNNAFVHAFVDNNSIIQISDTDKEAWGAAYPANGRAVQFEQVEVYGKDAFAHELMNAAYYTAYNMKKYGMIPVLANNGQGTLWSHHYVSQFLGGTDHTDPDAYWARNASNYFGSSYNMSDFLHLVELYYNE